MVINAADAAFIYCVVELRGPLRQNPQSSKSHLWPHTYSYRENAPSTWEL